jgi:hypothetical protein
MEYFNNRTEVVKAFEYLWEKEFEIVGNDLKLYYQNSLRSQEFRDIVYQSNLLEFGNYYGQEFFSDVSLILSSYQNIGTYESIISIAKGIFGSQVQISFTGDNMQDINISSSANAEYPMVDVDNNSIVDINNNQLVSIDNRLNLEANKIEQVIRLFLPVGVKHNITLGILTNKSMSIKLKNKRGSKNGK